VITDLEPDILECEVKQTLGNIIMSKASRGDGNPAELFQIQKDDAVQVLHTICQFSFFFLMHILTFFIFLLFKLFLEQERIIFLFVAES